MTQQRTVLVVDDDESVLEAISAFLEASGLQVDTAGDGLTALGWIDASLPDVVVLDVRMPGLSGIEVCRNLRGRPETRSLPVLLMTAHDEDDVRRQGFEAGADDFIRKPVRGEELVARIRTHLRLKLLRDELELSREALERKARSQDELERMRDELTENLMADLLEPLAAAQVSLESLRQQPKAYDVVAEPYLRTTEDALATLATRLGRLLELARLEPASLEVRAQRFDPSRALRGVAAELRERARRGQKSFSHEIPAQLPALEADRDLFERAISNLGRHALAISREEGHVKLSAVAGAEDIRVEIMDASHGMPEGTSAALFAETDGSSRVKATFAPRGLGLAFVRMAVEAHHGRIQVDSRLGEGTRYTLVWPLHRTSGPDASEP